MEMAFEKISFFAIFFFTSLVLYPAHCAEFSVGVSPALLEAGSVSPGEQKILKFSIFTVSDEPLLVYFSVENGTMDYFNMRFPQVLAQYSQEPASSWIEFTANPVEIEIGSEKTMDRSWKEIVVILKVPENAEPGYHLVHVTPKPAVYGGTGGPAGTAIVTSVSLSISFNVTGDARRDGLILDHIASQAKNSIIYSIVFQNTGTVTMFCQPKTVVYGANGSFIGEYTVPGEFVLPGAIKWFAIAFPGGRAGDDYIVDSSVDYVFAKAERNETIRTSYFPQIAETEPKEEFPYWIFAIIAIVASALIYRWYREKK
jgi:hypothetical protein